MSRCQSRHPDTTKRCTRTKAHVGPHVAFSGARVKGNRKINAWVDGAPDEEGEDEDST